jgi:probable phosphoglycerate mutase
MTRLLVVRHARAARSDDLRLPGPDLALLPEGVEQAQALAARLRPLAPSLVVTSDARRAWHTGELITSACAADLQSAPALREIDLGDWSGQTFASVVAADPLAAAWFDDPDHTAPPGGERGSEAAARVLNLFQELSRFGLETVVVVGHAGSLRLALATALGMPLAAYWRLHLDCASLSILTWTAAGPIVTSLNDISHLEALPSAGSTTPGLRP